MALRPYYDTDEEEYHYVGKDADDLQDTSRSNNIYRDERSGFLYGRPGDPIHSNDDEEDADEDSGEEIIMTNSRNHRL